MNTPMAVRAGIALVLLGSPVLAAAPAAAQDAKPRVAVLALQNNSSFQYWRDHIGGSAADALTTELVRSGHFSVIERAQIDAVLREQNFSVGGAVDPATAVELGRLLGAQALVVGSVTRFSIETRSGGFGRVAASYSEAESALDVRMINATTGEIVVAARGEGKKRMGGARVRDINFQQRFDEGVALEALEPAVEKVAEQLVGERGKLTTMTGAVSAGAIVGAREGSVYLNRGENLGVRVGQRFDVYRVVDEIKDASGRVLDRVEQKVGVIEVSQVLSQSSVCRVVEGEAREGDAVRGG